MAIYVDNVCIKWRNNHWCHLVADTLEELHDFAEQLGLHQKWFQINASYPHYDITTQSRVIAIKLGAIEGTRYQIIRCARQLKSQLDFKESSYVKKQLSLF